MSIQFTYTQARANLANILNEVSSNREIVVIKRRKAEDVSIIATSELTGLIETAHLFRSSKNAQRLLTALNRIHSEKTQSQSIEELKKELGFE
jgi:antitoxin YefM